jgi:hypothetical protein
MERPISRRLGSVGDLSRPARRRILGHAWWAPVRGMVSLPIVAIDHLFGSVSLAALLEIWNEYVDWKTYVMATLPEEEQMFVTSMNNEKVWVIEDDQAFTLLYPEDY